MNLRTLLLPGVVRGTTALVVAVLAIAVPVSAHAHAEDGWSGAGGGWSGDWWSSDSAWSPTDARAVGVQHLRVDDLAISPNGDGRSDVADISFTLRRTTSAVRTRVVDASGALVRDLGTTDRRNGSHAELAWNGTNDAGVLVADGAYKLVLERLDLRGTVTGTLQLDVRVDTTVPQLTATRPSLKQVQALAVRAAKVRDAQRYWKRGRYRQWREAWEQGQMRVPVTVTLAEPGRLDVATQVGTRTRSTSTWRGAGATTIHAQLPAYVPGARASITLTTADDAGNERRHTITFTLAKLPAPKAPKRHKGRDGHDGGSNGGGGTAPPANLPSTAGSPLPAWLAPIMLRATYAADVPQSWAKSKALSNVLLRESSYRPTAQNPTSTAYGLFQFLDQTWATVGCTKTSDAYKQSVCGLRYIQRRYRTPERAWAFWQANHWY